jgi:hypothetical protein
VNTRGYPGRRFRADCRTSIVTDTVATTIQTGQALPFVPPPRALHDEVVPTSG